MSGIREASSTRTACGMSTRRSCLRGYAQGSAGIRRRFGGDRISATHLSEISACILARDSRSSARPGDQSRGYDRPRAPSPPRSRSTARHMGQVGLCAEWMRVGAGGRVATRDLRCARGDLPAREEDPVVEYRREDTEEDDDDRREGRDRCEVVEHALEPQNRNGNELQSRLHPREVTGPRAPPSCASYSPWASWEGRTRPIRSHPPSDPRRSSLTSSRRCRRRSPLPGAS